MVIDTFPPQWESPTWGAVKENISLVQLLILRQYGWGTKWLWNTSTVLTLQICNSLAVEQHVYEVGLVSRWLSGEATLPSAVAHPGAINPPSVRHFWDSLWLDTSALLISGPFWSETKQLCSCLARCLWCIISSWGNTVFGGKKIYAPPGADLMERCPWLWPLTGLSS